MKIDDGQAKILVVDDEPLNIEMLSAILDDIGEILFATSGPVAIDICIREQPDVVLLDVMMPDMDGYEVCRRLKETPETQHIPVIFATARSDESDEAKGFEVGAVDYVVKPFSAPIVTARVRNHIELKRYRDYLANIAYIDGLTGIPNRRNFDNVCQLEWKRGLRGTAMLALMLIDIDHFKQFNDTYGHQAGDDCLARVAKALSQSVHRPGDLVARYGGEEFVCLLPETGLEGASAIARTLLQAVSNLNVPHSGSSAADHVTISIGVASAKISETGSAAALLALADENLYKAKSAGRNRIVAA